MSKVMRGTKEPNSTSRGGRGQDTHVAESPQPTDGFKGDNYTPKNVRFQTDYRPRNPIPIYCFSVASFREYWQKIFDTHNLPKPSIEVNNRDNTIEVKQGSGVLASVNVPPDPTNELPDRKQLSKSLAELNRKLNWRFMQLKR